MKTFPGYKPFLKTFSGMKNFGALSTPKNEKINSEKLLK